MVFLKPLLALSSRDLQNLEFAPSQILDFVNARDPYPREDRYYTRIYQEPRILHNYKTALEYGSRALTKPKIFKEKSNVL